MFNRELRKGSAELLVLTFLEARPRHGYEVGKLIEARSHGRISFRIGSLYPILCRLEDRGLISMTDEYDVQDLLGALLKLHFADVRPEEWTPSYAGNASRMDFLLKPEQIVVEAKMTRKGLGQKELVSQLAEDILRYRSHQDCRTLMCFVYDPAGNCTSPTALENDLTKSHGDLQVIVIVQPKSR